jgi:hypothetical protein
MNLPGILLLALAPLAAPPSQSEPEWGVVRARELASPARAALAALNAAAEVPFRAEALPGGSVGRVHVLHGGGFATGSHDPAEAALRFLRAHGALLGIVPAARDLRAAVSVRGSAPARVYVTLELAGVPLAGVDCVVVVDEHGRVVRASGAAPELPPAPPAFALSDALAAQVARDSVRAVSGTAIDWREAVVVPVYFATADGLRPALRCDLTALAGAPAYSVYVDAQTGGELAREDRILRGGKWPNGDKFIHFGTTTATGRVYRNQADALAGIATKQSLKNWSTGVPKPFNIAKGFLVGSRVFVVNDAGPFLFKPAGSFLFDPLTQADRFDQVNTYYQIESFYGHLTHALGTALGSNFALPVVVNVKTPEVNAFFSPTLFPLLGHTQGFIVLNDMSDTLGVEGDISRDPTVVHHEYTHAWVHYEHEAFQGDLDYPTRAMGEAVADFFALAYAKDGAIGRYIAQIAFGQPSFRDLRDDDHFPETVLDAMTLTVSGLPEEHRSGEVMGALMLDLRAAAGAKRAEQLVFAALPSMPNHMGPVGFPVVTPANALEASGTYFATCILALLAVAEGPGDVQDVLGAATGRGVLGDPASELELFVNLEQFPNKKAVFPSRFVVATGQTFFFKAKPGRLLRVKITGAASGSVLPDFTITGANGEPNPTRGVDPKVFSGQVVEQTGIELLLPQGSVYAIEVTTQAGTSGEYTLVLDV